jgi:glycosidase
MNTLVFADNHDLNRFYSDLHEDLDDWKVAMAFLLTTRGTPMIYYGTEILMTGEEHQGHGFIREDFPGGWPGDSLNCFTAEGRNADQEEAWNHLSKLMHWRNGNEVIHNGELKHFIPDDGLYVYFRYLADKAVMIIINNHKDDQKNVDPNDYSEITSHYEYGFDILSETRYGLSETITIEPRSVMVLELE